MSKKFEVGDKVRLTETMTYHRVFDVGHVATIVGLSVDASYRRVHFEGDSHDWWLVNVSGIELVVEEKRKFEVGDKVRDIKYDKGATGVVVEIYENFGFPYSVRYDVGGGRGSYGESALELIAPAAPSPKFNIGDRVKVVGIGALAKVIGHIVEDGYSTSYFVRYENSGRRVEHFGSSLTLHTPRTWSKPAASQSIALDVIDTLVDEMTRALRAHGGDCETRRFGDVMVVVENGQAKIYRLEASGEIG